MPNATHQDTPGRHGWLRLPRIPLTLELENKGSVARDHLALERTFLAWLRTSLGLVSIGIAVAQLFRIPSITSSPKTLDWSSAPLHTRPSQQQVFDSLYYDDGALAAQETFTRAEVMRMLQLAATQDPITPEKLGKPIGCVCIALGALSLLFGTYRFFKVQRNLIQGKFPPSRSSVSIMAFLTGALIVACFIVIVYTRSSVPGSKSLDLSSVLY